MAEVHPVTWWLHQYLSGAISASETPQAVLSWSRFFIYEHARDTVLLDTKEDRVAALTKVPEELRGLVEAEVKRLWPLRASLNPDPDADTPARPRT